MVQKSKRKKRLYSPRGHLCRLLLLQSGTEDLPLSCKHIHYKLRENLEQSDLLSQTCKSHKKKSSVYKMKKTKAGKLEGLKKGGKKENSTYFYISSIIIEGIFQCLIILPMQQMTWASLWNYLLSPSDNKQIYLSRVYCNWSCKQNLESS